MKAWKILFLIFLIVASVLIIKNEPPYHTDRGFIFGTYYNICYKSKENLQHKIDSTLKSVDNSLSPFNKRSVITAINENRDTIVDAQFSEVFALAQEISNTTDGAFDITVAPLVNAWGFGFKQGITVDSITVDSLLQYVGYKSVELTDNKVIKQHPQTMLDCSAIAKGYGCDRVARMLESYGVKDYMVEIGGEVVSKGKNNKSKQWSIGISKPTDDKSGTINELQEILHISGKSVATSGNYRNYRYEDGRKLSHTIDPRTGYPVAHTLLSATVIANDCATADAYATAFMVIGIEKAIEICKQKEIDAYFIYSTPEGGISTRETDGMKMYHK
ncbi:MAG: FAD:protein FMN transferase [Bacteroidaceae bacterium]|nr:FAD:protein FMN transferase [Bacteroidaceae bacterium]